VAPTIFADVKNSMRISQEEIFGPVMSVIPFDSEEEAFRIANDNQYGLSGGVWTRDISRAHRAFRVMRAGKVYVNSYGDNMPMVPYGGVKQSGHGRMNGAESLREFTTSKSVWIKI
jgi:acyl-CoA reductase-like NAD-dependent aldehyde dehydrogenase